MSKLVLENINRYLYGPSDDEIEKRLEKTDLNSIIFLKKSAKAGFLKGVKKAIKEGNEQGIYMIEAINDALRIAAEHDHLNIVEYLIEQGAYINQFNSPLYYAARSGNLDIVKYLVDSGANINIENEKALRAAVLKGHLDVVKYLVEQGANIHIWDDEVLHYAKQLGYTDIVEYLIKHSDNR